MDCVVPIFVNMRYFVKGLVLLLTLLAVNLGVGALSRATPSLNVFAVGFAVSLLVGFGLLFVLMPAITEQMVGLWQEAGAYIRPQLRAGS